ncbi:MAG: hypothetical protein R3Y24_00235 [Eubacteriales bacterium]
MSETNQWMNDPTLQKIPRIKLEFIQKLFFEGKKLSPKEMLPFFLSVATRSKKENIQFSEEEMQTIVNVLKNHATPEEITKMNQAMKMMRAQSTSK